MMKGKQNKHEVFREPYAKTAKKRVLVELNSSKEEESDEALPLDETEYLRVPSKKRKKRDKKNERQLVEKIGEFCFEEPASSTITDQPAEIKEDRKGTPVRKKKKSKKVLDHLVSIQESSKEPSTEYHVKRHKKKGKRKLNEDDESMLEPKEHPRKEKSSKKAKVNLDNSYEASESGEDTADRINAEQNLLKSSNKYKKSAKKLQYAKKLKKLRNSKKEKLRLKNAYEALEATKL